MKKHSSSVSHAPYYQLSPEDIVYQLKEKSEDRIRTNSIMGIELQIFPHVFPEGFRSTAFLLDSIQKIVKDKTVCDMGCATGIVGLYALSKGAKKVVQADINPHAVANAKVNRKLHSHTPRKLQIYESDCFSNIPKQKFDLIIFNIPFHTDPFDIHDPLEYAFHDPLFRTLKRFLEQARAYIHSKSQIIIAFSNKGDVSTLERIFSSFGFEWKLWKTAHTDEQYDSRLYMLTDPI